MFHYTTEVPYSAGDTLALIEESLKNQKFGVLFTLDLKETLSKKGVEFDKSYTLLEVCNPHEAKRVLEMDSTAGYFLPCKIAVYEEGGKTKIGMPKPTALISMIDNPELQKVAEDIENRLIGCIDAIKG